MSPPDPVRTETRPADDASAVAAAATILRAGGCVAVPTETVYGLACDASNGQAVAGVYAAKGRPRFNPLIAHVDGLERAERVAVPDDRARALADALWPGPLTLVLPRRADGPVSDLAAAGLDTIAVRAPDSQAMRALIAAVGAPLAAPSANPSGAVSPTTADHVADGLSGRIALILDGGPCRVGLESTIVSLAEPGRAVLLRPGGTAREAIEAVIGPLEDPDTSHDAAPHSPGRLKSHYAPKAALRLNAAAPEPGEAFLAFGAETIHTNYPKINLSPSGSLTEAAANLFAALRTLDSQADRIAAAPIPDEGLGAAINDRLTRAAAPRQS